MALDTLRYRRIWDSAAITATSTGDINFFSDSGTKTLDRMNPLIDGRLPDGERMAIFRIACWVGERVEVVDAADDIVLHGAYLRILVNDGEGNDEKIAGHLSMFPEGGGAAVGITSTADLALEGQSYTNGIPGRHAMFVLPQEAPIVLKPNVAFRGVVNIPTALTGLTNGRLFIAMEGLFRKEIAS